MAGAQCMMNREKLISEIQCNMLQLQRERNNVNVKLHKDQNSYMMDEHILFT